jgi:hypothetical protein
MGPWIPALVGALLDFAYSAVGRVLLALGVSFVTFTGVMAGFVAMKTMVISKFTGLGADILGLMSLMGLDVGITVILSAYAYKISIKIGNGAFKKMMYK